MVNFGFIPASIAGIVGLLLILSFVIKPLKSFRMAVTGWAGKYATLIAIAFVVILLAFAGRSAWLGDKWASVAGGTLATGSILGDKNVVSASALTDLECKFATPNLVGALVTNGVSFTADPNDLSHYNVYVIHNNGTNSINGTLSCVRQGDIELSARSTCYVKAESFKSETSTSDANVYYILATTSKKSEVAGFPWAQTAYLKDGAIATTSSDQEKTDLVFTGGASAEAQEDLGYYITFVGQTAFNYLNNQTSNDVNIFCDVNGVDKKVATLTITKVSA